MTGLEKIIGQIRNESEDLTAKIMAKAKAEADEILAEAERQAAAECEKISHSSDNAVADRLARGESAAALQKRKTVLAEKQKLIGEVIEKAKQSLYVLPDEEYFKVIVKMAEKFSLDKEGEILFSEKDLSRLPAGFEVTLNSAIGKKNAKLTVSKDTRKIDGGFVLAYGGVEENCSFTAMFDSAHEELQDKVQELLFT